MGAAAALLLSGLLAAWQHRRAEAARPPLGLFTSLPLLWRESADVAGLLDGGTRATHWAAAALGARHRLVALDTLLPQRLEPLRALVMAQPRPLAPAENVALDGWVRRGGHLLLFADPLRTADSAFAPGDPRRAQDVVLLSPILGHWGLRLTFDPDQPGGAREIAGIGLPVDLPGRFVLLPGAAHPCTIEAAGLIAQCRIGAGNALIVADSALFDAPDGSTPDAAQRSVVLRHLLDRALGD